MIYCSTVPPTTLTKFEKERENLKRKLFLLLHGLCFCNQKYDRQMVSHFYDEFSISRAAGGICRGLPAAVYCRPSTASSDSWNRNANMRNHFYLPCLRVYLQRIPKSADKREISFIPDRRKKWFEGEFFEVWISSHLEILYLSAAELLCLFLSPEKSLSRRGLIMRWKSAQRERLNFRARVRHGAKEA